MSGININNANFQEIKIENYQAKNGELAHIEDGLTKKEINEIDQDKDGVLTEEEFKKLKGSDEEKNALWNALTNSVKTKTETEKNGNTITTQEINGQTITSTYNKNGDLINYSATITNSDKSKTVKNYTVNNDQHKLDTTVEFNAKGQKVSSTKTNNDGSNTTQKFILGTDSVESTTTKFRNGLTQVINESTKDVTQIAADGTSITKTKDGKYKQIVDGNKTTNFTYDSNGEIKSISITEGGKTKTYSGKNITARKGGGYNVKDNNGKWVFNTEIASDGREQVNYYKADGTPDTMLRMDAHGYPESHVVRVGGSGSDKWTWKKATFCSTGNYREYEPGISRDYTKDGRLTSIQTYYQNAEQLFDHVSNSSVWSSQITFNEDGSVKNYYTWDYEKNGDGTVTQTGNAYDSADIASFDKAKGTVIFAEGAESNKKVISQKDGYRNTISSETFDKEGKSKEKVEYFYDQNPIKTTQDRNSIKTKIVYKDGKKYIETWSFGTLMKTEAVGFYTEEYTYHNTGAMESKTRTSADNKEKTVSTYRDDGTNETETTSKNIGTQRNILMNHKEFDEKGNLELNEDYTYQDLGRSWQKLSEVKTTDGEGNLVNNKKYNKYGLLSKETEVFYDGSVKETNYRQINNGEPVPNIVEERDANGDVTKNQRSLFQVIKDRYPGLTDSQAQMLCNTYIAPFNTNIDAETLLTAEDIKNIDFSRFRVENGNLVLPS